MYGARKASLKIVFLKHICAFFSVRGNIGAICSFDNPDPDSDTEGSTRTMRLLKLHYHQQQVSSWSLFFCTIFETNKQTNKPSGPRPSPFTTKFWVRLTPYPRKICSGQGPSTNCKVPSASNKLFNRWTKTIRPYVNPPGNWQWSLWTCKIFIRLY